jgi:diguanylate cyclase (GGDEF)-like protein
MTLGLYPDESRDALDALQRMGPGTPDEAGFFTGIPTGLVTGIGEGGAKLSELFAGGLSGAIRQSRTFGDAGNILPSALVGKALDIHPEESDDDRDARIRANAQEALNYLKPDPAKIGFAGRILHGFASVGFRAAVAGPEAAALSEGYATSEDLQAQGVDKNTANVMGVANALMTGAGLRLPVISGVGKTLTTRVVSGATVNTIMGAADRATMHTVLANNGYDAMAAQYRVMDGQAMLVDALLGGVFGAHGLAHDRAALRENLLSTMGIQTSIDAALTTNENIHINNDLTPGAPTSPAELDEHGENLVRATEALLNGDDPPDVRMPQTVPNPAQERIREANAAGVADAQAEVLGEHGVAPGEPERAANEERRQDAIDQARMAELRTARSSRSLTPDETEEYATLLERDRLAAKAGGRVLPGVQNMTAYAEAMERGELKDTQGFADLDMLKSLNDELGHQAGDEAIHVFARELAHYFGEGNVFHRGGDEFITQSESPEAHDAAMANVRQYLDNHTIRVYKGGDTIERRGVRFSHGNGKTAELAEQAAYADKQARAAQGLRSERSDVRPVAEKPGENRPGGNTQTAGAAARVKTPLQAVTALTRALKALRDSGGQDAQSHESARALLAHIAKSGWDEAAIGRAAVERAGPGAERALEAARVRDTPVASTAGLDAETRESVERAQSAIDERPELSIKHPATGTAVNAHDALNDSLDQLKGAKAEGELAKVAAACFARVV